MAVVVGKTTARVIVAREKGDSERVDSSSALFARLVDAVEAIEKRRTFRKAFTTFKRSDSSHLLDSLEEEAPEAHPRIECPVVERAAAGAARIRSEEVGTRSCVSSPKRNTRRRLER